MTAPHADQIIDGYLSRLNTEAADLPKARREELLQDAREHIAEARANLSNETDADILNILDRLGQPADLVQEARDRFGLQPSQAFRPGLVEIGAIVLLPLFWIVGVILLWTSNAWNTRDKLIGTFLPPGGFAGLFMLRMFLAAVGPFAGFSYGCGEVTTNGPSGQVTQSSCSAGPPAWLSTVGPVLLVVLIFSVTVLPVLTSIYLGIRLRKERTRPVRTAVLTPHEVGS